MKKSASSPSAIGPRRRSRRLAPAPTRSCNPVAAEELGADGAYFRVHHFARQLGSPFPLLAACGAKTKAIEIGTTVIDMRYENPMYMAEDAGAADLIAGGRLQLGISRGSPEQVIDGWCYFGFAPPEGMSDADMARRHTEVFNAARNTERESTALAVLLEEVYKQRGAKAILHTHSSSHWSAAVLHSTLIFAALMMGHHFSISDL